MPSTAHLLNVFGWGAGSNFFAAQAWRVMYSAVGDRRMVMTSLLPILQFFAASARLHLGFSYSPASIGGFCENV